MPGNSEEEARRIKRRYSAQYLRLPEVSGFGVERDKTGRYVITIHVNDLRIRKRLPKEIEGYPVRVIESGPFRAIR